MYKILIISIKYNKKQYFTIADGHYISVTVALH